MVDSVLFYIICDLHSVLNCVLILEPVVIGQQQVVQPQQGQVIMVQMPDGQLVPAQIQGMQYQPASAPDLEIEPNVNSPLQPLRPAYNPNMPGIEQQEEGQEGQANVTYGAVNVNGNDNVETCA